MSNTTTLVMLSGGMDSTAVLVEMLTKTEDPIHVHHVKLVNMDGRQEAEYEAVLKIRAYCHIHYRPFNYSESGLDFTAFRAVYPDYLLVAFMSAVVARDLEGPVRAAVGIVGGDAAFARKCNKHQSDVAKLMYVAHRFIAKYPKLDNFELFHPLMNRTKRDIVRDILPPELMALTWSCRRPIRYVGGYSVCAQCKTCLERAEALQ